MNNEKNKNTIKYLLNEIKAFYWEHSKEELLKHKLVKANIRQIDEYEKLIGEKLPEDYKIFLLENEFEFNFDMNFKVLSIEESIRKWQLMADLLDNGTFNDGRIEYHEKNDFYNWHGDYIKKVWWNKKWIPVSQDSCGNMECIDLDPGINGKKYQIVNMEIQDGQGPFIDKYSSFTDYLEKHLEYLKNGQYDFEDYGSYKCITIDSYKKPQ